MKPLAPNTLIQNRYLVVHLIGKGGMGEVYLAVDQRLGSAVALKRTFYAGDEMLGAAFEREAKILARLRHPVLPKVSDHFGENSDQYLVMEHISGDDLSNRLEAAGKAFPMSWVMFWADQLLDALSYLHSHEPPIIHRDIKPQNLKLTDENHIVLLDFGLSKDSTGQTIASQPGKSGSVVGYTPHFASMEQIRGTGTDARSDIYSLSATLYQLATNTVPVDALTRADAMLGGAADPIVPLSVANPEISPAVSNVILKGLEVSRDKRFSSAAEMQKALRTAHSQMQGQMSAATQVFTVGDIHQTVPPMADPTAPIAPSEMATRTPTFNPEAPIVEVAPNDATVQMSAEDVVAIEPFGEKTEVMIDMSAVEPEVVPAETMAAVPIEAAVDVVPAAPEFFTEAIVEVPAEPETPIVETPPPTPLETPEERPQAIKPAPYSAVSTAAAPAKASKSGGSKAGLILGGLAAVFALLIAASAGGWYYYANYIDKPSSVPTATPSPTPSPTASATPEASPEANSNVNSNSNTASPSPTPESQPTTIGPKPQATPPTRDTAPKPVKTPGAKPTPKPKTGGDRTVILQ